MTKSNLKHLSSMIEYIRRDAESAIRLIYKDYRGSFIRFGKKYTKDEHLIIEAFQNTVIAFYQNIVENKVTETDTKVKTYLFAIGKNQILSNLNRLKRERSVSYKPPEDVDKITLDEDILISMKKLGETCQQLIILFYYRNYSIESIANELGMKNENSVKANKSRCIKKLKALIEERKKNQHD